MSARIKKIIVSPLFVGIIFFLLIQLQLFNLNIDFRDEGLLLNSAAKINNGEIPYRDFPLITTPGTYYIQAFIMHMFGNYIVIDRFIYIVFFIFILLFSSKLFKFDSYLDYVFLILLSIVYVGERAYGFYNIESVTLVIASLFFFNKLQAKKNVYLYSFLIGMCSSFSFVIKQSYGGMSLFVFLLLISLFIGKKLLFKNLLAYLIGILIVLVPFFLFYYISGAFEKLIYYIFYLPKLVKSHRIPFVVTSLLFIPFFALVISILQKFSFKRIAFAITLLFVFFVIYILIAKERITYLSSIIKDLSTYYYLFFLVFPLIVIGKFIKEKNYQAKQILIISIAALGLFLASSSSGRDYSTVVVVAPFYIPLFILVWNRLGRKFKFPLKNVILTLILSIFIFPSIFYSTKALINLYGNKVVYREMYGKEGKNIKLPKLQSGDLEDIITYINKTTSASEKLLCFPYCPLINFLSGKDNASYFSFFYSEIFRIDDQEEVVKDLKKTNNVIIVMQKPGPIEKEANFENKRLNVLKDYILTQYKLVLVTNNFLIYRN